MRTPSINTRGNFVLKNPYVARPEVIYRVTALRKFSDIYLKGGDVYQQYYHNVGLVNDTNINGSIFSFDVEAALNPLIVTLEGSDDTVIYVPTTYIISYPVASSVMYSRIVLAADLGAMPDDVAIDSILDDVKDIIQARFGVESVISVNRAYTDRQPSAEEHEILEDSRIGSITSNTNNHSEIIQLKETLALAHAKITTMTKILVENSLI